MILTLVYVWFAFLGEFLMIMVKHETPITFRSIYEFKNKKVIISTLGDNLEFSSVSNSVTVKWHLFFISEYLKTNRVLFNIARQSYGVI